MENLTSTQCINAMLDAIPGPKSDCCGTPIERVADELFLCTGCGKLCDEADLFLTGARPLRPHQDQKDTAF